MKQRSLQFFFGGGVVMIAMTFLIAPQNPVNEVLGRALLSVILVALLVQLWWLQWRPKVILDDRLNLALMLLANFCTVGAVVGEALLYRTQSSHLLVLWPMLYAGGFFVRSLLRLQILISVLSLLIILLLKVTFIRPDALWFMDVVVMSLGLLFGGLSIHVFREMATREAQELNRMATTDFLTQLMNRRGLFGQFPVWASEIPSSERVGLVMLDLDHFKSVNDRYGHDMGDAVLQAFADTLRDHVRPTDLVARLGGEEFVWVTTDQHTAHLLQRVERVRSAFQGRPEARGTTVSAGVTLSAAQVKPELAALLKAADLALYDAKEAGRNRAHLAAGEYAPPLGAEASARVR